MDPIEDFEHQLMLSGFLLASHALRLLDKAGLLDDQAGEVVRQHLRLLSEKLEAAPDSAELSAFLDVLVRVLPPPRSGGD